MNLFRKKIFLILLFLSLFLLRRATPSLALVRETNIRTGKVSYLSFSDQPITIFLHNTVQQNPETVARTYFANHGLQFGINNQQEELRLISIRGPSESPKTIKFGTFPLTPTTMPLDTFQHVRFQQVYKNIPVFAGEVIVHLKNTQIFSLSAEFTPNITLNTTPLISPLEAENIARKNWENLGLFVGKISTLGLYILNPSMFSERENQNYLVWYVEISDSSVAPTQREFLFIDAYNGTIRFILPGILEAKNRKIYDCVSGCSLARSENQGPVGIAEVDNAHQYAGNTYDYFFNKHNRDSFNNGGAAIIIYTRYPCVSPNAYWMGSYIKLCSEMTTLDIIAHEFTHGVTQETAGLVYSYQQGALNEAFSDIFASQVDGNWTMGEGSKIGIIRDMSNPPAKGHPDRLFSNLYYCDPYGQNQNRYVHSNSGVANKAAYLISEGGTFNGCTISGLGRENMGKVEYSALTNYLTSSSNFKAYYNAMNDTCGAIYGTGSFECQQVINALKAVEVDQQPGGSSTSPKCSGQTPTTPSCSTPNIPSSTPVLSPTTGPSPTLGPSPTAGPSPTIPTGAPTVTPIPTQIQSTPTPTILPQNADVSVWNSLMQGNQEVILANGTRLAKGTRVSICYNRKSGPFTLTINRGAGLVTKYLADFPQEKKGGCLHAGDLRFFPLGELASNEGSPHVYSIESGGKTVSTTILVTTGVPPPPTIPPQPTATTGPTPTSGPTPTIDPSPTLGPTATPPPNATVTPTGQPTATPPQIDIGALINSVSEDKIKEYLSNLVDNDNISGVDEQQTRYSPTSGNRTEADYIKNHFQTLGIESEFQDFTISGQGTRNIIGKISGANSNEVYLVTAHMDSTASDADPNVIAPGADDNGSGTAIVVEAARVLKTIAPQLKKSLEFVAFSGEEQGLYGSYYYVRDKLSGKIVKGVINLDMVGNRGSSDCVKFGYKEANREKFLSDKIVNINTQYSIGLTATSVPTNIDGSDHARFWEQNKPAIFGHECSFSPVYHTTNDKTSYINYSQLTKVAKTVVGALASLAVE